MLVACDTAPQPMRQYDSVRFLAPDSLLNEFPAEADLILERPFALDASEAGIVVSDVLAGRVHRFDWDGRLAAQAGQRGEGPGELQAPMSVRLWPDESVWTSDIRNRRITHYSADGEMLNMFSSPGGYEFVPLNENSVLVPSPNGPLLIVIHSDGNFETISDSASYPDELSRLQPVDRVGIRQLLLSRRDTSTVVLLHNVPDFSTWVLNLDLESNSLISADKTPLPEWFEIEARGRLSELQTKLDQDDLLLVPFNAMHDPTPGTIWLTTGTLGSMIGAQLPIESDDKSIAVMALNDEKRGLLDAVLVGDRLVALYETAVRVYSLKEITVTEW